MLNIHRKNYASTKNYIVKYYVTRMLGEKERWPNNVYKDSNYIKKSEEM